MSIDSPASVLSPKSNGHLPYRRDIDGLRAIAVTSVVLFHYFPKLLQGGFVGVDVFFVISGYLIGRIILEGLSAGTFSFRMFYARRVKRIFPALLVVLLTCYAVGWFNLLDGEFKELGKHVAAGAGFVANFALWHEAGYFDAASDTKPLLHLWSLGVEEQFYVFWPLMLWTFQKSRRGMALLIVAVGVASFALNVAMVGSDPTADFYSPFTRFWELMVGCGLAYQHVSGRSVAADRADIKSVVGFVLIAVAVLLLRGQVAFPGWRALLPTVGAYLLIDAGAAAWCNRQLLSTRALVWLGLVSFPLYLWHWPILAFLRILDGETPPWYIRAGALTVSVALAWLTYRLVERPVRLGSPAKWKVVVPVVALAGIGLVGFNTYQRDGLSFRLSKMATQFTAVQKDVTARWREHACFLSDGDDSREFAPQCTDAGTGPLVFLWGDSFAAALSPGLRSIQHDYAFRLAQYTVSGCPPLLGVDAESHRCGDIQQRAFSALKRDHPSLVILTALWTPGRLAHLPDTIEALRDAGATDIVLVGPVPFWRDSLATVYWRYWRKYHETLPVRTRFELDTQTAQIDRRAQAIAEQLGIRYVSAYQALCDSDGCETRTGPGKGTITAFDVAHLTPAASVSLLQSVAPEMLPPIVSHRLANQ